MNEQMIVLALASLTGFLIVGLVLGAVAFPIVKRNRLGSRLRAVAKRREALQQQARAKAEAARKAKTKKSVISESHVDLMKRLLEKLDWENLMQARQMRNSLAQAGFRGQAPLIIFAFMRVLTPVALPLVAAFFVFAARGGPLAELETLYKWGIIAGAAGIGYFLPGIMVTNMGQGRQKGMTAGFPDALDLLVICVEAGLSLEASFSRVATELLESAPIVSQEFGLTTVELGFLPERRQALENLANRCNLDSVKSLTTALIQSEKYGTPLASTLRVLSQESRDARMSLAEQKAASLGAKMTVPMMVFILPVMFLVIIGPAGIQISASM